MHTALKVIEVWFAASFLVFLPLWIAAHGGLRGEH
jgi:hypothetical protein